jgi:hypothetical protein
MKSFTLFIGGFLEGFLLPLIWLIGIISIFTIQSFFQVAQIIYNQTSPIYNIASPNIDFFGVIILFSVISLFENFFAGCLKDKCFNYGYVIGAISGVGIFCNAFMGLFQQSIFDITVTLIIITLGVIFRFYISEESI